MTKETKATLPQGVLQKPGFGGVGIQLYRIEGSCRGEMEEPCGYGATLEDALKNGGHLAEENLRRRLESNAQAFI